MARSTQTPNPDLLGALGALWLITALWTFSPVLTWGLTRFLVGTAFPGSSTPVPAQGWIVTQAVPWFGVATVVLLICFIVLLRRGGRRRAAGKSLEQLRSLTPVEFERWVGARFQDHGYHVRTTAVSGDHGVDLVATRDAEKVIVQCKRYRERSVGEPALRDVYGAMQHEQADRAYVVTTGYFTAAAVAWARGKPLELWDGQYLAGLGGSNDAAPAVVGARELDVQPVGAQPVRCPRCDSPLVEKRNRRTDEPFLACPRYPNCRYAQAMRG